MKMELYMTRTEYFKRIVLSATLTISSAAAFVFFLPQLAHAEVGVSDSTITIGMANAQSGPTDHGRGLEAGATAFFKNLNQSGGVNGRKINLLVADDVYDPQKTVTITTKFLETDKVFALFGYLGSANSAALMPTLAKFDVPYIAPLSGAQNLRSPVNKNVFTVRAGYEDEAEAMVAFASEKLGIHDIGVLYQDDALGNSGKSGIYKALAKRGIKLKASASYDRTSGNIDSALAQLAKADVKAILCFATSKPYISLLKLANKLRIKAAFISSSIVGEKDALAGAKMEADGTYYIAAFPLATDMSFEIVKNLNRDIKTVDGATADDFSLEGYADAAIFTEALRRAGKNLTRDTLRSAFEAMNDVTVEGLKVAYSHQDHQALHSVFVKQIKSGIAQPVR
jgi:branched-chain amino acid transport system substrate-binding protein